MMTIRKMTILFGCLAISWTARASDDCSSCSDGIKVRFMMEEDIKGKFSVTLNGVTTEGEGYDTTEKSGTYWGETKLVPDQEYDVTVDVGKDEDEYIDKDDSATILFEGDSCGYVFEVYSVPPHSGPPNENDWKETKEATVWSNEGNSVWEFGAGDEKPVSDQHIMKVRFRKTDDSEAGEDDNSQGSPTITDPGSDYPTSSSSQPIGITGPRISHSIQLGNATRYSGEEKLRVSAGNLRLTGAIGDTSLASRSNLKYNVLSGAGTKLKQPVGGAIEQVETGSILAIAADEASGFSVKLYGVGSYQEIGTTGVFEPAQGATPFSIFLYEPLEASASQSHTGGIRITKTANGSTLKREIVAPVAGSSSWRETIYDSQTEAALQITESHSVFIPVADGTQWKWQRTDVITVTRDGVPYSKTEEDWIYETWGQALSKRRAFITINTPPEETTYTYYTDPAKAYYGKRKNVIHPDGSWAEFVYQDGSSLTNGYAPGQLLYRYEPWRSLPSVPTQSNAARTEYFYAVDPKTDLGYFATVSDKIIRTVSGTTVSQTDTDSNLTHTTTHTSMDASTALSREVHYSIAPNWMNYPDKVISPDGTATKYSYDKLEYDPVTGIYTSSANGKFTEVIRKNGYLNASAVAYVAGQSTGSRTITNAMGRTVRQGMLVYTGSGGGWTEVSGDTWLHEDTNGDAMPDKTTHFKDGQTMSIVQKINELETHSWDRAGWQTITIADELGRTKSIRRVGRNGQADILTSYFYSGRDTTVTVTGGTLSVESGTTYDLLGRMLSSTDENGLVTYRAYGFATGGGRTVTTTRPDGKTEIESYHLDGKLRSITGTGVVARYYEYEVDDGAGAELGFITTTERIGSDISPRLTDTKRDWYGQTRKVTRPAYTGTWLSQRFYKSNGQLYRVQETGLAPIRYEYDSLGAMFRTGRDVGSNGALDMNSTDSITETSIDYVEEAGTGWVQQRTTLQWLTDDNSAATTISVVKSVIADPYGYTRMLDVHSDPTTSIVSVASGVVTTTTNVPFSDIDIVRKTEGGRLISENTATVATPTEYGYDALGRMTSVTDPQGAVTNITYEPGTYRQKTVTPPVGPYMEYLYIPQDQNIPEGQNGAGQIWEVITRDRANGAELSRLSYAYDARGNRVSETGSGTYPVKFIYDPVYPEMTGLKTYRDSAGTADLTTWVFQDKTGLLTRKQYADTNGTDYTYHDSGLLHTRTWQRNASGSSNRITTTYLYDTSGMPDTVTYSDGSAAPIDYQYNRAGRMTRVTDAAGIRTYTHEDDGQVATETITGTGLLAGYTTTHSFGTAGHGLRDSISVAYGSATIVANSFGYEPATGRFHSAAQAGHTATYGYQSNTDREASITHHDGSSDLFTKRTHRDLGGRVTGVVSRAGSTPGGPILSSAGYLLDAKGRRRALTREDGTRWDYGYNTRDEVESGVKRQSGGNLLAGRQFSYEYDDVGNRKTARFGGDENGGYLRTIGYTPDELNQYDTITHPGIAQVLGYSPDAGAITATPDQQGSTIVQGDFWRAEIKAANSATGIWADVEAQQVVSDNPATIGQGKLWIPPATENPTYDDDGNLKQDGRWEYTWNGENRLVEMTPTAGAINGGGHPWMRLSFQYDFMGRRIEKKVETGSSTSPEVTVNRLFLYDGWNLIAEIDTTSGTAKTHATYLWGLDVAGASGPGSSMQSAGGVGGILLCRQDTNGDGTVDAEYRPSFDGNGNIIVWISAAGSVVERSDYDPFGRVLTRQGNVDGLAFGFSTKYTDSETGLCYYGYRYYDPLTGRWPSRDPIEERGGVNLYGIVMNDVVNHHDLLGMKICKEADNPGVGPRKAQALAGNIDFVKFIKNKYEDKNICIEIYSPKEGSLAHSSEQIIEAAKRHSADEKYKKVLLLGTAHGLIPSLAGIVGVNQFPACNLNHLTHETYYANGAVNTNKLRNDVEASGGGKAAFYQYACQANAHFKGKNSWAFISYIRYLNLDASSQKLYDTTKIWYVNSVLGGHSGDWEAFAQRQLSSIEDKPVKVAIYLFNGPK